MLTATKDFEYDQNGNVLEVREYDWISYSTIQRSSPTSCPPAGGEFLPVPRPCGLPSGLVLKRRTTNTYYYATPNVLDPGQNSSYHYSNQSAPKLLHLLKSSEVKDGSGSVKARSEFFYDGGISSPNKGNLTETRVWDSLKSGINQPYSNPLTTANSISTTAVYDQYGNPTLVKDAKLNQTQITYGSVNGFTGLYPTQTISAYTTAIARTSTAAYDFYTGLVTTATDVNNNVSVMNEYDALGRSTKVRTAANTSLESQVRTEYGDAARRVIVRSDLESIGDGKKVAVQHFDQLGRVRLSRSIENAATEDPYNEIHGIKVQTRYMASGVCTFDAAKTCSSQLSSNPYRAAYSTGAGGETTMGWTLSQTRNDGRHGETETFGGAALPKPFLTFGFNTNTSGKVQSDIDANATTVTDQAGKLRRSITNALGQLSRVDEPNGSNLLGAVSTPNQATYYSYNTLGKMIRVQQGVQNRYFMYDSLGRTLRIRQPEQEVNTGLNTSGNPDNNSWSAGFTYDNNGNVLTTTDAKGTMITSTYDALNRPLTRTYSDGITPAVTNFYDGTGLPSVPPFSKGKLTKVSSSVSESKYTSFDQLGRLLQSQQVTDGQTYTSSYQYNLSGALVQETYPSGRVVKNEFETDGDLARIFGKPTSTATEQTYANSFSYTPDGKIEKLKLGNGLWESAKLNARSQVTELALGHSVSDGSRLKLNHTYGELQADGTTVDPTKNAGNIAKQTVSFTGLANPFVQTYKYDSLDRITEVVEKVNGTQSWKQTYGYDIYGNRNSFYQIIGSQLLAINNLTRPMVDTNTNRFAASQGYSYDKNGNITNDPVNANRTFTFNGDNKQIQVKDVNNATIGTYSYDGNGCRVKKVTNLETTVFVYNGTGNLVAEYSTATPPANPTINYTATDQLGSPRVITDKFGQVVSRRDFMPFGEELFPDGQYRTTGSKYSMAGQDAVRQRFTGYQKDLETGLDFAEARYYNNQHGRFTAVDPLLASGKSADPQTFNRYVYVMNRPLILTDSDGMQAGSCPAGVPGTGCAVVDEVIRVVTILFTSDQRRRDFLMNSVINNTTTSLDQVNFDRVRNQMSAVSGDSNAINKLDRKLIGNKGPTVDSVVQGATDAVRTSNDISNTAITINSLLLIIPTPRV